MEHLGNDELNEILGRINDWIENCESKVSTILSGMGVFAGILLATDYVSKIVSIFRAVSKNMNVGSAVYAVISFASSGLLIYGVFLLIRILFSRVNLKEFKDKGVKIDSILFFSSIARNKTLSSYSYKIKRCSNEQLREDLISQIYICALICDKKFALYRKGLLFSITGFVVFVITLVIGAAVF